MSDNFNPTFDVQQALEYARKKISKGLTENQRKEWKQSLNELRAEIPLQIKRQNLSALSLSKICYI